MLLNECLIPLAVSVAISICSATKVLPRGRLPVVEFPDVAEFYEVTVNTNDGTDAALRPRLKLPAIPTQKHLTSSDRSHEKVKRTLLGSRQNCNNYCSASGLCCPDDGECCGDGCSPRVGQCCMDGTACDAGLVCVQFNGRVTCCEDVSCSEYQGSGTQSILSAVTDPAVTESATSVAAIDTASVPPPSLTLDSASDLSLSSVRSLSLPNKPSRPSRPTPTDVTLSSFNNLGTSATHVSSFDTVGTSATHVSSSNTVGTSATHISSFNTGTSATSLSSLNNVGTSATNVAGGGSLASPGPGPAGCAWAMGLTVAAMAVGAGIVLL